VLSVGRILFGGDQRPIMHWMDQHNPRLLEHRMIYRFAKDPYMGVLGGSYLLREGSCVPADSEKLYFDYQPGYKRTVFTLERPPNQYRAHPAVSGKETLRMQLQWHKSPGSCLVVCALLLQSIECSCTSPTRLGLAAIVSPSSGGRHSKRKKATTLLGGIAGR
jgi:hypothetical protein